MPLINMKQVEGGDRLQKAVDEMIKNFGVDKDTLYNSMLNWLKETAPADFDPTVNQNTRLDALVNSVTGGERVIEIPYLSFIEENGEPFTLEFGGEPDGILYYSIDTKEWQVWNRDIRDGFETLHSSEHGKLYLRGLGNTMMNASPANCFAMPEDKRIQCAGNIETLLDYKKVQNGEAPLMGENCFTSLFWGCTALTKAPRLPSLTLKAACYAQMFSACTSLKIPPSLPATELSPGCYEGMFEGCTSLTDVPDLPATELPDYCYTRMFEGCTSLNDIAMDILATEIGWQSYEGMFNGCSNLKGTIHCCRSTKDSSGQLIIDSNNIHIIYDIDDGVVYPCLSFVEENNESFTLKTDCGEKKWDGILSYSIDKINWTVWNGEEIASSGNGRLYLRGDGNSHITQFREAYYGNPEGAFVLTPNKRIQCLGNIETLLNCRKVKKEEPITMGSSCYTNLFKHCTSLTQPPELPATTLTYCCYGGMFSECTSLTGYMELPATKLDTKCYERMFSECGKADILIRCPEATKNDEDRLALDNSTSITVRYDL